MKLQIPKSENHFVPDFHSLVIFGHCYASQPENEIVTG